MQLPPTETQIEAAHRLESAIGRRDAGSVESAINQTFSVLHSIHAPALILLAEASWHQRTRMLRLHSLTSEIGVLSVMAS
jgi:hypothetical protein